MTDAASLFGSDANLAGALFAVDPFGLGGVAARGWPGPARDVWLAMMACFRVGPTIRIPLSVDDSRLLGGLDLSASLAAGRPIIQQGLLARADGGWAVLSMAERIDEAMAGKLAAVLDRGEVVIERDGLAARSLARTGLIALDEGLEPEEKPPEALLDRLAFQIELGPNPVDLQERWPEMSRSVVSARAAIATLEPPADVVIEALGLSAEALGVGSVRALLFALRAARAHAALGARTEIGLEDLAVAARLVLAPRAMASRADEPSEDTSQAESVDRPPRDTQRQREREREREREKEKEKEKEKEADPAPPEPLESMDLDRVVEAIKAALPDSLLNQSGANIERQARAARGRGQGASTQSSKRGRPIGSRPGSLNGDSRVSVSDTLRAAAPWQKLRSAAIASGLIQIRADDLRIRRFVQRRESTTIFVVDASGSSAFQRLAEAKGAVELLLAKAYVTRARVALIAFRNTGAEVVLTPTRSLARAKRTLADLAGGGGTPLAAAIDAALVLAQAEKGKDRTPFLVFLTDGQANIGRDGVPGRPVAEAQALLAAKGVRLAGVTAAFIDTSPRVRPNGDRFARAMGAVYAPLPYADATTLSSLVTRIRPNG